MSGVLFTGDNYQSLKNDGTINSSGTLTFYSPGTTTLKTVYADQALVTPITNPVALDSHGRATVYLDGTNYDLYVKDSTGTLLYSVLNIYTPPTATATMAEWTGNSQDSATSYSGTQVSGASFTIATDVTSSFHVGRRIKVIQGGTTVYGYIVSSSYGAPNTTVTTINDTGASFPAGALTVYPSLLRADNHALPATAAYVLESNDAGATIGPAFTLDRNSASPAAADVLGGVLLNGRNSGAASKTYAQIQGEIVSPTAASEAGQVTIWAMVAGALTKLGTINSTNGFNSVYGVYDNSKRLGQVLLFDSGAINASAGVEVTSVIDNTKYLEYEICLYNVVPAVATLLGIQVSSTNGSPYDANARYLQSYHDSSTVGTGSDGGGEANTLMAISGATNPANTAPGISGTIHLYVPSGAGTGMQAIYDITYTDGTHSHRVSGMNDYNFAVVVNAFKIFFSGQNISSGRFTVWGVIL